MLAFGSTINVSNFPPSVGNDQARGKPGDEAANNTHHPSQFSSASALTHRAHASFENFLRGPNPFPFRIGIVAEKAGERRVPLTPQQCHELQEHYRSLRLVIQSSEHRIFPDEAYAKAGVAVVEDLSECEVLLGVKEMPVEKLLANKIHIFFSHTHKGQNLEALRKYCASRITLIDWERMIDNLGKRLVGFGYFAGLAGAYNGLRGWMMRYRKEANALVPPESLQGGFEEFTQALKKLDSIGNCRVVVTGVGRASTGAQEVLRLAGFREVSAKEFLKSAHFPNQNDEDQTCPSGSASGIGGNIFNNKIFTVLAPQDYVKRIDQTPFDKADFYANPQHYRSAFGPYSRCANIFMACHFHAPGAPAFFTVKDAQAEDFALEFVADISCDLWNNGAGPIPCTKRASTISAPFYVWDPHEDIEYVFESSDGNLRGGIGATSISNLPSLTPKMASEGFGQEVIKHVLSRLLDGDEDGMLRRATLLYEGQLTPPYHYLSTQANGLPCLPEQRLEPLAEQHLLAA